MKHDFGIVNITVACYIPDGEGSIVHNRRKNHGIVLNLNGHAVYEFENGDCVNTHKGDLLYLPQGLSYHIKTGKKGNCYAINFNLAEPTKFHPFIFHTKQPAPYLERFKESTAAWQTKEIGYPMVCKTKLCEILTMMQQEYNNAYIYQKTERIILPALQYIHEEYINNISIPYLAELCHISECYLRRIFLQVFGMSPLAYINNLRIERAKELLSSRLYTMDAVTKLCGFRDESYFSRKFKKATGVPPSKYYSIE